MKEFISAVEDAETEDNGNKVPMLDANDEPMRDASGDIIMIDPHVPFVLKGRVLRAFDPTPGQLVFMLSALGRGQNDATRFANIINLMYSTLSQDDQDFIEGHLLERDRTKRVEPKVIEEIFEYLVEQWFARPTQQSSGSAPSPQSSGD